ncbi:MAG: RIP metalloprotease RseP [Alphaproteobacteria bacterium]|nr:RIP metalloprotease RseP [Alphaproteobacteria bacterium]
MNWVIDYFVPFVAVLTVLVFIHELGHFLIARRNKVKVTTFSIGFGPELFGWTDSHETRWRFSLIPLGGYVKMLGDADASSARADESIENFTEEEKQQTLHSKTPLQRIAVSIAGPAANYILAIVLLTALIGIKGMPVLPTTVGKVEPEMLAHQAGIAAGDKILKINEKNVEDFDQLRALIKENIGKDVQIEISRNGEILHKSFALYKTNTATGEREPVSKLGVAPGEPLYVKQNPIAAIGYAGAFCWKMSIDTLKGIGGMITAQKGSGEIGGILSIGDMAAQSTKNGLPTIIFFMAILSINLGLINLLPIPVLDGGHILLCAIEWVRGKPLGQKVQEYIFLTGFLVVVGTMLFATWNDLMRYKIFQIIKNWF